LNNLSVELDINTAEGITIATLKTSAIDILNSLYKYKNKEVGYTNQEDYITDITTLMSIEEVLKYYMGEKAQEDWVNEVIAKNKEK